MNHQQLARYLVISGFIFLLLLSASYILQIENIARTIFEKNSQKKIQKIIDQKHEANENLKNSLRNKGLNNLQVLTTSKDYHSVFNKGNLIYWGSNIFLPDYKRVKGDYHEKYLELNSGKFLIIKDTFLLKKEVFEIINLIPLYFSYNLSNQYIKSGPNPELFTSSVTEINNYEIDKDISIKTRSGNYLFSIQFSENLAHGSVILDLLIAISLFIFILFLCAWFWNILPVVHAFVLVKLRLKTQLYWKKYEADFYLTTIFILALLIRATLLLCKLPHKILYIKYFNPKYYNWNSFTPSPGDMLIHIIFILGFIIAFKILFKRTAIFENITLKQKTDHNGFDFVVIIFLGLSQLSLYVSGKSLYSIFDTLKYRIDISEIISSNASFYLAIAQFILSAGIFIALSRLAFEMMSRRFISSLLRQYLPSSILFLLICYNYSPLLSVAVCIIHLVFYLLTTFLKIPSTKFSFDYSALVYYTLGGLCCAVIGTYSLSQLFPKRDLELKTNFITQQLIENNLLGESILNEISRQVANDKYVANGFSNTMFSVKDMEEKVRRFYLGNYLNRYDIQIKAFDDKGYSLNEEDPRTFQQVINRYPYKLYKTNYPEVYYFITQQNQILKNYLCNVIINNNGIKSGSILIELQIKKFIPNSIVPFLLVDRKAENFQSSNSYSYAVYNNEVLTNTFGNFNFKKEIIQKILIDSGKFNSNVEINGSYFLVSDLGKGRKIIVQSETISRWVLVSNMSFLFIITELAIFLFFIGNLIVFDFDQFYNSLTFKIQFYTITAFFIPVSLVSTGVLTAVISSYNQELRNHFKENATNIAYALNEELEKYYFKSGDLEKLKDYVLRSARLHNTDINIYRRSGRLLVSSSPVLYESGLVSTLVNPYAYYAIKHEKNNLHLQEEQIGSLEYNHVYVQIQSSETGEDLGIISIPFFASGKELSARITNALKIIVNIATFTFMVFIFFSYAASNFITYPLKLITLRIRKTTLEGDNRPLEWKSKDELGLLIREYNQMIQKLDQNKKAMALNQKEIAWREVAQQVAHEIKNPLTPIKLSLQHLRRVITDGKITHPEKLDKTFENLINQVETLDGIASSFSIYAKMPSLQLTTVDLKKVLEQVIDVYKTEKKVLIEHYVPIEDILVEADERMLGRILGNILLNSFQAIPNDRDGNIRIDTQINEDIVSINITDNGTGIPNEVLKKIFEPHFSTKFSGSGIGLFIVKKGIEQMGGSISCNSGITGTTFSLTLKKRFS